MDESLFGEKDRAISTISGLYAEIDAALKATFPKSREIWVQGEIQKISQSRGHCYIDVVDSLAGTPQQAETLKVKCWASNWRGLKTGLADQGLFLEAGMTILMRGAIDFYRVRAEVGFILAEIDVTALLGRLAVERAKLLEALQSEGLFDAQRQLSVPLGPLRIGLVGSPGTEGFNDFLGQLEESGFSFAVDVARASVQGENAPSEIARAITQLSDGSVDLICVVRGGGSKGDLAAFDAELVARAIARSSTPIWTGIGHSGDESVADLVANRRAITPTALGAALVTIIAEYYGEVLWSAGRVAQCAQDIVARRELAYGQIRGQLVGIVKGHLRHHLGELRHTRRRLIGAPTVALDRARSSLATRSVRLAPLALRAVEFESESLSGTRRLLSAYDPVRTLERGWSLTLDHQGKAIRSIDQVAEGTELTTRVADGVFASKVMAKEKEQ